jgi:CubicO group peptidase (beta-lactamase class C family)
VANSSGWRSAEIGAANGHTNARGIARLLSAVTNGGSVDGVKLLSPATIDKIFEEQAFGRDQAMGYILRFGIGYGLAGKDTEVEFVPEGKTCFWGGYGGSVAIMDVGRGVTITYMMNKMSQVGLGNDAAKEYTRAVYKALGVE